MPRFARSLIAVAGLLAAPAIHAVTIQIDYTYDNLNGGSFFAGNAAARNALEAAAADISAAILPTLSEVPEDVFVGEDGDTEVTINWRLNVTNPVTNNNVSQATFSFGQDVIVIYPGLRRLGGTTLGQGGPSGVGVNIGFNGFEEEMEFALSDAESQSNDIMPREGGPLMGSISGEITVGDTTGEYELEYGASSGSVSFDLDRDNNNSDDSPTVMNNFWHFDHTTPVAAGKSDFYSVALHEMLHAIGFGTSDTWEDSRSGTTWLGSEALQLNGGSGINLVTPDGHIRDGFMSTRLRDGAPQEVAMDPSITNGFRKELTLMDLAFLSDLGYDVVPEPASGALIAAAGLLLARRRRVG